MVDVALIYPFTSPPNSRSIFRYPPLGLGYIASYLIENKVEVELFDCTFLSIKDTVERVKEIKPRIVGVYSMFTMKENSLKVGRSLRESCELMVVGGPLPTVDPVSFLEVFDVSVVGEGEQTMLEIVNTDGELDSVDGVVYKKNKGCQQIKEPAKVNDIVYTSPRRLIRDLNSIPFPARELYDNEGYKNHYRRKGLSTITSIMSSRGCPFNCDFCSKPVFGESFRQRSPENVVEEALEALSLGYDRIFFQDDCFTMSSEWINRFCDEVTNREIGFEWECLSRVDTLTLDAAERMRKAGCRRVYFGLESGNDEVLKIMNKQTTVERARISVQAAAEAGIETGAFFIVGYPGETDETILETIRLALDLPLNYLSFSLPYPIPGTGLYEKLQNHLLADRQEPRHRRFIDHELIYCSEFSETKLKFAILKAMVQFRVKNRLGSAAPVFNKPFEYFTDRIFKMMS